MTVLLINGAAAIAIVGALALTMSAAHHLRPHLPRRGRRMLRRAQP